MRLDTEKKTPYEVIASTEKSQIDLNTLLKIDGIENASPYLSFDGEFLFGEVKWSCPVNAVYSTVLRESVKGRIFPDDTNMPYLLLNQAAVKALAEGEEKIVVSVDDPVLLQMGTSEQKCVICGIYDDGKSSPLAYMSYNLASREIPTESMRQFAFSLTNKGFAESAVPKLQKQGFSATLDPNITLAWELMVQQVWQFTAMSLTLLACSGFLIRERRKGEVRERESEREALLLNGFTRRNAQSAYRLRILITDGICLAMVSIIAAITGSLSAIAIVIGLGLAIVHYIALNV